MFLDTRVRVSFMLPQIQIFVNSLFYARFCGIFSFFEASSTFCSSSVPGSRPGSIPQSGTHSLIYIMKNQNRSSQYHSFWCGRKTTGRFPLPRGDLQPADAVGALWRHVLVSGYHLFRFAIDWFLRKRQHRQNCLSKKIPSQLQLEREGIFVSMGEILASYLDFPSNL